MSFLSRVGKALHRTRKVISDRLKLLGSGRGEVDKDEFLSALEEALIVADVGMEFTERVVSVLEKDFSKISSGGLESLMLRVKDEFISTLKAAESAFPRSIHKPLVVMVVGVNGSGKTTTIGKLSKMFVDKGKKVLMVAADTFRAAASEQLEVWAERSGAFLFKKGEGADPASVVFDALAHAVSKGYDMVFIDTAGRIHTKDALMRELEKVKRVSGKVLPGSPHEVILVLDATVGQNGLSQVNHFLEKIGVTGIVVTKLDGTFKGGVLVPIVEKTRLPVYFIGVGEGIDDLIPFSSEEFVESLFKDFTLV